MNIVLGREVDDARIENMRATFPNATFTSVVKDPGSMKDADAFLGRIPTEVYAGATDRLKWVHSLGAGIETIIAIPELVASDVVVTNTRGAHAPFVAEHTFALLLAVNRSLLKFANDKRDHVYTSYGRDVPMESLYSKRMLIVGMGNIGRAIAQRAVAFDMSVVGVDMFPPKQQSPDLPIYSLDELDREIPESDVVVIAVPHTPDTTNLINADRIGAMKQNSILIGISRGNIIDEEALAARLNDGSLFGAGLDVFHQEPLPTDNFLFDTPNLVMTPHCAPKSALTRDREYEITYENIKLFLDGNPLMNVCDKVKGF